MCTDTCVVFPTNYASDGYCDDGGAGSEYSNCGSGTDCTDCGPRLVLPSPPLGTSLGSSAAQTSTGMLALVIVLGIGLAGLSCITLVLVLRRRKLHRGREDSTHDSPPSERSYRDPVSPSPPKGVGQAGTDRPDLASPGRVLRDGAASSRAGRVLVDGSADSRTVVKLGGSAHASRSSETFGPPVAAPTLPSRLWMPPLPLSTPLEDLLAMCSDANLSGRLSQSSCSALSAGFMGAVPAPPSARTRFGQHLGGVPQLPLHHTSEQQVSAARQYVDKLRQQADEAEAHQRIASARVKVLQEEARIIKDDALEQSASARERDKQLWLTMMKRVEEAKQLEEASVAAKHLADVEAERVLAHVELSKRGAELEWERVRALIAESLASDGITDSARDRLKQLLQTSYHTKRSPSELSDSTPSGSTRGSACNTPVSSTRGVVVGTSSASSFTVNSPLPPPQRVVVGTSSASSFTVNLPLPPPHRLPAPLVSHVEQMVEQASYAARQRPSETEGESSARLHRLRHAAALRRMELQGERAMTGPAVALALTRSQSPRISRQSPRLSSTGGQPYETGDLGGRISAQSPRISAHSPLQLRLPAQLASCGFLSPTPSSPGGPLTPMGSDRAGTPMGMAREEVTPAPRSQEETTLRVRAGASQRVRGSVTPLLTPGETPPVTPAPWSQEETTFRVRGGATQRVRGPVTPRLNPQLTPPVRVPVTPRLTPGETPRVRGSENPHRGVGMAKLVAHSTAIQIAAAIKLQSVGRGRAARRRASLKRQGSSRIELLATQRRSDLVEGPGRQIGRGSTRPNVPSATREPTAAPTYTAEPTAAPRRASRIEPAERAHRASGRTALPSSNSAPHRDRVPEPVEPASPTSPTSPTKISQWL